MTSVGGRVVQDPLPPQPFFTPEQKQTIEIILSVCVLVFLLLWRHYEPSVTYDIQDSFFGSIFSASNKGKFQIKGYFKYASELNFPQQEHNRIKNDINAEIQQELIEFQEYKTKKPTLAELSRHIISAIERLAPKYKLTNLSVQITEYQELEPIKESEEMRPGIIVGREEED